MAVLFCIEPLVFEVCRNLEHLRPHPRRDHSRSSQARPDRTIGNHEPEWSAHRLGTCQGGSEHFGMIWSLIHIRGQESSYKYHSNTKYQSKANCDPITCPLRKQNDCLVGHRESFVSTQELKFRSGDKAKWQLTNILHGERWSLYSTQLYLAW